MPRPRLLDLYCGAGGAAVGYERAGFDVVGVDLRPQPNYPFPFLRADVIEVMRYWPDCSLEAEEFDAIHASPPCQVNSTVSRWQAMGRRPPEENGHADLLTPTRELLRNTGLPWVIENVPGAPMRKDLILCGSMFDLDVRRHRWFELNFTPPLVSPCHHANEAVGVYGHGGEHYQPMSVWETAMGIDWMNRAELAQAIPPAYTEYIGQALLDQLARSAA